MDTLDKHPLEDQASYLGHLSRHPPSSSSAHRSLRHHHSHGIDALQLETQAHVSWLSVTMLYVVVGKLPILSI
jgi:hypothetical protein